VATADDLRRIALELPEAYERASHDNQSSFRTKPRMFAALRDDGDVAVLWVADEGEKHALVTSEADKFFTTPHYDGHPIVLVRLAAVDVDELAELVTESWRLRASTAAVRAWDEA